MFKMKRGLVQSISGEGRLKEISSTNTRGRAVIRFESGSTFSQFEN